MRMWNMVIDQVPQYLWLGKGYGGRSSDMGLLKESMRRGYISDFEGAYIAGDYHSGPLSLLLPLGVFGVALFLWFLGASTLALYRNYRYGPPELRRVNTFLLAYFLAQTVFFLVIFGTFTGGLFVFSGTMAFSISVNGGVHRAPQPVYRTNSGPAISHENAQGALEQSGAAGAHA